MAVNQIFVKLLDGRTRCLQISSPSISGADLKQSLFLLTRIPAPLHRLVSGSREVHDESVLYSDAGGLFPSCALLLRLPGGKGGFGSLLRGAATKAGQKKTSNFDACRDMSGRRLRHVNAEKKLEEWQAEAAERRLEKIAEQFIKKKAKEAAKNGGADVEKYLKKFREDAERCAEEVEESVRESFMLYKESKRKVFPGTAAPDAKRLKIWLGKKKMDDSDSGSDEDDEKEDVDNESVVLDDGSLEGNIKEGKEVISTFESHSEGESSGSGSVQSNLEESNEDLEGGQKELGDGFGSNDGNVDSDDCIGAEAGSCQDGSPAELTSDISTLESLPVAKDLNVTSYTDAECDEVRKLSSSEAVSGASEEPNAEIGKPIDHGVATKSPVVCTGEPLQQRNGVSSAEEPLEFDKFNSSAELEVLGMGRLKKELQSRGLKCGGTLQERAARLFLLKTTPLEKLPKKVLAKPEGK